MASVLRRRRATPRRWQRSVVEARLSYPASGRQAGRPIPGCGRRRTAWRIAEQWPAAALYRPVFSRRRDARPRIGTYRPRARSNGPASRTFCRASAGCARARTHRRARPCIDATRLLGGVRRAVGLSRAAEIRDPGWLLRSRSHRAGRLPRYAYRDHRRRRRTCGAPRLRFPRARSG